MQYRTAFNAELRASLNVIEQATITADQATYVIECVDSNESRKALQRPYVYVTGPVT